MRTEDRSYLEGFPVGHESRDSSMHPDQVPPAPAGFDESYLSHFAAQTSEDSGQPSGDPHQHSSDQLEDGELHSLSSGHADELDGDASPSLSDMARTSHKHKRRIFGLLLLIIAVLSTVGAIIGLRYWFEIQKSKRSSVPAAIVPAGDNQSVATAKPTATLGVDSQNKSDSSPGNARPGSGTSTEPSSGKPGPLSGPAQVAQSGPGQPLMPASPTGFDANGRPIPSAPIVPPNRFDSPLGVQDGRGYVNAVPNTGAGASNATNNSGAGSSTGAQGLFNPLQYLQQMGQVNGGANAPQPTTTGSFSGSLASTKTPPAKASLIGNRSLMLAKGALIPCVLDTAVVSSVSSMVRCHTPKNIFSEDGKVVLFEAGSQIKGEFSSSALKTGSKRLYILWSRIDTPLGIKIDLESPGADQLGRGGLDGDIDKHWGERIGSAFLLSFVQDAIAYAATRGGNQYGPGVYQNTTNTGNQMATEVLKDTIAIPPTLSINQGELVNIFVARDLDFSDVYQLKVK